MQAIATILVIWCVIGAVVLLDAMRSRPRPGWDIVPLLILLWPATVYFNVCRAFGRRK